MRPFSDRFRASLRDSHLIATQCDLYFPDGSPPVTVPVEAGTVTCDRTAQVRRSGTVTIPWSLEIGQDLGLDLRTLPLGGYARLYRGLRYADRTRELMLLGHLRVESVAWRTSEQSATLELADRMAQVRDEPFLAPYAPATLPSVTRTGTLTDDSPVVSGLSQTSDLIAGMLVSGKGIVPGSKIVTVDSASQVTLSKPANIYAIKSTIVVATSDLFDVDTTTDLFVGMTMGGTFYAGDTLLEILTATRGRSSRTWHSESFPAETTFTLPASQSLTFSGTVKIADVAVDIAQQVFGDRIGYQKLIDPAVVLGDVFYTGSRADALQQLALAAGGETYFDANGDYVFAPSAGSGDPVWMIDAGERGVLVGADEALNRTGVYNGVLMQGQNTATDAPIAALVVDDTAGSPTLWGGPFGKVARIEQSSAVQTQTQAQDAAQQLLDRRLTLTRSLTVTAAPNPALEADDIVEVTFPDGRLERHVVNVVRTDLGPQATQALVLQSVYLPASSEQLPPATRRYGVYAGQAAWRQLREAQTVGA